MRNICKKVKGICLGLGIALVVSGASLAGFGMPAYAWGADKVEEKSPFEMQAALIASDKDTYNLQVSVENLGKDWEGTVRVIPTENYRMPSAYDRTLSLPEGSKKEFVLKIPKGATDDYDGGVKVLLLNKRSKVEAEQNFKNLLLQQMDCVNMGILSDDYSSLTFLDMGGTTLYYYGSNMPIKLAEVTQDNLDNMLDTLAILVIDKYNTAVLTPDQCKEINLWVDKGGLLIVGTGAHAEDTLGGLGDVLTGINYSEVTSAGTEANTPFFGTGDLDVSQLDMARLNVSDNTYMECYFSYGYAASRADGACAVLPYSLVDLNKPGSALYVNTTQEVYVQNVLEELSCYASARYASNTTAGVYMNNLGIMERMLGVVGNIDSTLNFGILKFLVVVYVIFVGPVLYLILRSAKKRELYWVTVPAAALVGIVLIFFAGRGFEVADTRVYSVTARDLSAQKGATTYLYCYDADHKEWDLQLADGYEYAGALLNSEYGYDEEENKYYHRIQNEAGKLSIGIDPSASFEDSFFLAGKSQDSLEDVGTITVEPGSYWGDLNLQVTNQTNRDFTYYGVVLSSTLYVYKDLKAGETILLNETAPIYTSVHGFSVRNDYMNDFVRKEYRDTKSDEDIAAISALGAGLIQAYPMSDDSVVVVCGLVEDWEPAVDDKCKEISYGCLYVVER